MRTGMFRFSIWLAPSALRNFFDAASMLGRQQHAVLTYEVAINQSFVQQKGIQIPWVHSGGGRGGEPRLVDLNGI